MVGARTSKRVRSAVGRMERQPSSKRKLLPDDDEILSDEVDSDVDSAPSPSTSVPVDGEESEHENETAEQKRLRLARAYLRHMGVSEDAGGSEDEESDGDGELDNSNILLRQKALQESGNSTVHIAEKFTQNLSSIKSRSCRGHALSPTCVALSKDGESTAVSGGKDSRLIVWDVETGTRNFVFKPTVERRSKKNPALAEGHIGNILTAAVTDDARMAVSGGKDSFIRVWDIRSGKLVETLRGHRGPVNSLAFRSNSSQLFSASTDRTVKVWDLNEMAYVETLFGHGAEVNSVSSLAMERAVSCGRDGTLRMYKVAEGSQLVFRRAQTMSVDAITMVTENRFFSGGDDGAICIWQTNKKKPTAILENAHGSGHGCDTWISSVSAFRSSDLAISGAGDGFLRFWECKDTPKLRSAGQFDVGTGFVNGIAVGERHRVLVAAVGNEHRLGRWTRLKGARNKIHFLSLPEIN